MVVDTATFQDKTKSWDVPERASTIWNKLAARLGEEPDEGDMFLAKPRQRSMSEWGRMWDRYVDECKDSFETRADAVDDRGRARVVDMYRTSGDKRYSDLMDYMGRHRARLIYDSAGTLTEVVQKDKEGKETVYSKSSFDAGHESQAQADSIVKKVEKALASNHSSYQDKSVKQAKVTEQVVLGVAREFLDAIIKIIEAEDEGQRSILPKDETIEKMTLERCAEHLDKTGLL